MLAKCAEAQAAANTPLQLYLNTILLSWLRCGTDRTSRKAGGLLLASIIRSRSFETELVHAESSRPISAACGLHGRCRRDLGRFARRALPRRIQGARSGKNFPPMNADLMPSMTRACDSTCASIWCRCFSSFSISRSRFCFPGPWPSARSGLSASGR